MTYFPKDEKFEHHFHVLKRGQKRCVCSFTLKDGVEISTHMMTQGAWLGMVRNHRSKCFFSTPKVAKNSKIGRPAMHLRRLVVPSPSSCVPCVDDPQSVRNGFSTGTDVTSTVVASIVSGQNPTRE